MKKIIKKIYNFVILAFSYLMKGQGFYAYQCYVEHHKSAHPHEKILSYAEFFRSEQQRKWQSIKRCC